MRCLFKIDTKDYNPKGKAFVRHSARCITIKNGRVGMVHSAMYNYYKFPGGGIEDNETNIDALIRETQEEAGLDVVKESIQEFGVVHRIEKSDHKDIDYFVQDNFYYLCDTIKSNQPQHLDDYEKEEGFTLQWVTPKQAIHVNRFVDYGPKSQMMLEREAKVLAILMQEGYFKEGE